MSKLKVVEKNGVKYAVPYFPVGYIYISVSNENPSTHFGGTWVSFGAGKVLVGVDANDTDFNVVEKTGGEKTHTLTVNEMPSHNHRVPIDSFYNTDRQTNSDNGGGHISNISQGTNYNTDNRGGGQAHNNLQPYITVYMWKKTAN